MHRSHIVLSIFSIVGLVMAFSPSAVFAEHLDRMETRHIIRQISEKADMMEDHLDDWIQQGGHREERMHKVMELDKHIDNFESNLMGLRAQVINHAEPWDAREQAKAVVAAAGDVRQEMERSHYLPSEVMSDWESLRHDVHQLAEHYHLDEH